MKKLFTLGDLYISDFLKEKETPRSDKVEMKMVWDSKRSAPRLEKIASPEFMYGKYWYRSGINKTMTDELKGIVESITSQYQLNSGDIWLDIACNDGTLLKFVPEKCKKIGIDPVDDSYVNESKKYANYIVQDYFSEFSYNSVCKDLAKIITVIAMFYDLENPDIFLKDVNKIMHEDGVLVLQLSYTPLMINQMAFDNICHEHVYYYSLFSMKKLLENNGFQIVDCQLNDINGGSFRVYAMKKNANVEKFGTQPYRDVCNFRINSILSYEKLEKFNSPRIWNSFYKRLQVLKDKTYNFILEEKNNNKKIWGYGASTKGNTLLQYFNLDSTLIDGIAERSEYKFGLKTVGTNIPIYSEEYMRSENPDYLLILPWHFINEFINREKDFLINGGKFIVPCPEFKIIGIEDVKEYFNDK